MSIDARLLRHFVVVADEGQISRAARRLHMAQPALTQAIQRLETQVGVTLLDREPRGIRPTPAGEALLIKARAVVEALKDAEATASALVRSEGASIAWGFIGVPPMVDAPELFAAFAGVHPDADMTFRELGFPRASTARWLEPVDVALCYSPRVDPDVEAVLIRKEPRVVLLAPDHRLAGREELELADVLDEPFCGYHPALEPDWVAFWTLDDHRGGPPRKLTRDRATNPHETLAAVATGRAIATAPARNAASMLRSVDCVRAVILREAKPAELRLVWRRDTGSTLVRSLAALARSTGSAA
jgi:DNA-binding transcriptional LysR family regulator